MKYKIIFTSLILLITTASPTHGVLQPMPQEAGLDVAETFNTPDTEYSKSVQQQTKQIEQSEEPTVMTNSDSQSTSLNEIADVDIKNSATRFWFSLVFAIFGLVAAGLWVYFRFLRKGKV